MKKLFIIFLFVFIVMVSAYAQTSPEITGRIWTGGGKASWGMTYNEAMDEIKGVRESYYDIIEKDSTISFLGQISQYEAIITYGFYKGSLIHVECFINPQNQLHQGRNNNYSFIKELLTIDLGNPKMNKMLWKNNMYQSDPEKWDLAVHQGHLRYLTAFKKDNTLVECKMLGKEIPSATYIKYSYFKWALYQAKKLRDR